MEIFAWLIYVTECRQKALTNRQIALALTVRLLLKALQSCRYLSRLVWECYTRPQKVAECNKKIVLCRIPALEGNEKANVLVAPNKGSQIGSLCKKLLNFLLDNFLFLLLFTRLFNFRSMDAIKEEKIDFLMSADMDNEDCDIMWTQPKDIDGTLPQIQSVKVSC